MHDNFPLKLALGDYFYNRKSELALLKLNISKCRHSVLVSPRRYGKSSLVHKIVSELQMPFISIDLFLAHDDKTITQRILNGIADVLAQIMPANTRSLGIIQKIFSNFKITLGSQCFNIEMSYSSGLDTVDQIFTALRSLVKLAESKKKLVLFFIDEFQDIASANSSKSIQGAIRHVAQETSNIIFIFSGSNRHLLLELFDDKTMPLYMLCDKLHLQRMSSTDYYPYIQQAAITKWGEKLPEQTFNSIMSYTELHPFYVNFLCNEIWLSDTLPDTDDVFDAWSNCFENEERRIIAELEKLTNNQQDLLKALAIEPVTEPTGQQFLTTVGMAYSSIRQTIKALNAKDMIYKVKKEDDAILSLKKDQIRVLDPLLSFALRKLA
ncbi:MAG: ATP-binding protein [Gammaproteobacteria bacterium]|nr:ATP-binding protein [Gammaproteobacteria bacterium]